MKKQKNKNLKRIIECLLYTILFVIILCLDIKNIVTISFLILSLLFLFTYIYRFYKEKDNFVKKDK